MKGGAATAERALAKRRWRPRSDRAVKEGKSIVVHSLGVEICAEIRADLPDRLKGGPPRHRDIAK
eukprot:13444299-Alexandrium_andersonii.AAC.1